MMREFFVQELNATRTELLRMGALAEKALSDALLGIVNSDLEAAGRVKALEEAIDSSNRTIYDRCLRFINLQAPVASDTRYITGILEAIVNIERIGDYADDLADVAFALAGKPLPPFIQDFAVMGSHVQTMVRAALDTWATLDREQGLAVRDMDDLVDADYQRLFQSLSALVQQGAEDGDGSVPLYLVLVCRYLERIADHAVSAAEQAAYAAPNTTRPS